MKCEKRLSTQRKIGRVWRTGEKQASWREYQRMMAAGIEKGVSVERGAWRGGAGGALEQAAKA